MAGQIGYIFQKDAVSKYGLTPNECVVINWLIWFMDLDSNDSIEFRETRFYWLTYHKLICDIGKQLNINNVVSASKLMNSLCSKGILRKIDSGSHGIRKLYFAFSKTAKYELFNGVKTMDLFNVPNTESVNLHPNVVELLDELDKFYIEGEKRLFTFKNPIASGKITKSIKHFSTAMLDLYYGRFSRKKYFLNDKFASKNSELITERTYTIIDSCKGNWDKINDLVLTAAKNYLLWFSPNRQPFSKKWLTRDLGSWVYDSHFETSLFMACMLKPPEVIKSKLSKMVVDALPNNVYESAMKLKREYFPNIYTESVDLFWFSVNEVLKAEKKLKKLYPNNYAVSLWLDYSDLGEWTCKYLEWVKTCWGENTKRMLLPIHIGPKGKPWEKWFRSEENLSEIANELYLATIDTRNDD